GGGQFDVEDPGEGRLGRQETQERPHAYAEHELVVVRRSEGGDRAASRAEQQLGAVRRRGEEAVFLVGEVGVEGGPGHAGPAYDVRDGDVRVADGGDRGGHCADEPVALRGEDGVGGQAAPA